MKAVRIHKTGGAEVLTYEEAPTPQAGANEAVVKIEAIGVNFIDVYFRSGLYKAPGFPYTPGMEAAATKPRRTCRELRERITRSFIRSRSSIRKCGRLPKAAALTSSTTRLAPARSIEV